MTTDQLKTRRRGEYRPAPPPEGEEAGTQALSEALSSSFIIVKVLMAAVVIYLLCSGIFTVSQAEKAVILRFGKPVGDGEKALRGPGLHWAFPYPIDEVVRIPLGRVHTVRSTIGWYGVTAAEEAAKTPPLPLQTLNPETEGYLLTADGNIIHVRGILRYRINEPGLRYFLDFVNASNQVQQAFNNALTYATSRYSVDDALTRDTAGYRETVWRRLEELVDQQQLGITVDQIDLRAIAARQVEAEFQAVLQADLQRSKQLDQARSDANQIVSRAEAQANARKNAAETERDRFVEFVRADAKRFNDLLPAYRSNPALFIQQQQSDVLRRSFTNAQDKFILPRGQVRFQLNREPQRPKPPPPKEAEEHH